MLDRLIETYCQHDLLTKAIAAGRERATERQHQLREERTVVDAELAKAEEAIERYLLAFEAGTMPEATCSTRVQTLADKAATSRERRAQLQIDLDCSPRDPTPADIDTLRARIHDTIKGS